MNARRYLPILSLSAIICAACGGDGDREDDPGVNDGRMRGRSLLVEAESTHSYFNEHSLAMSGDHLLRITADPTTRSSELTWVEGSYEHDLVLIFTAWQNLDIAPPDTRYLDERDFSRFRVELITGETSQIGEVLRFEVTSDLLTGIHYGSALFRFTPPPDEKEAFDLALELEGFVEVYCTTTLDPLREATLDTRLPSRPEDPPACVEVFDRIRATPDDPDAPPPPYNLYAPDVIEDGPGGSTPVAPPD